MHVEQMHRFMNEQRLAVLATADSIGRPGAALMGYAVTPQLEITPQVGAIL